MITNILLSAILIAQIVTTIAIGGVGVELENIKHDIAAIRQHTFYTRLNTMGHEK